MIRMMVQSMIMFVLVLMQPDADYSRGWMATFSEIIYNQRPGYLLSNGGYQPEG
jgi:hypothetical protein